MLRYACLLRNYPTKPYANPIITHEVLNQVPYLENYNAFKAWPRLGECLRAYGADAKYHTAAVNLGEDTGSAYWLEQAHLANKNEPVFTPFDRQGRRIDQATFCESYPRLMHLALSSKMAALPYTDKQHGHVASCSLFFLGSQLEQGTSCPVTMTAACLPSLVEGGACFQPWIDKMTAGAYDHRDLHISLKTAATCGMSMTEKQGGSDVRQNTTFAVPLDAATAGNAGAAYRLTGHKWFTSAPMSDAFLTLGYSAPDEMSCFLVPRWISPTERNVGLRFQRLKSKMGDKSNASSEVEYNDAIGYLVGKPGSGVKTIIKMVNHTRLLCIVGSTSIMAGATSNAIHHCTYRQAFGRTLAQMPLMQNVLTDLALEVEAAIALFARVASSFDEGGPLSKEYQRLAVAIGKYHVTKRTPALVYEAMECMGGNGYLEDFPVARYFRQSPLNAIWEGSGNVIVMDIFRTLVKAPKTLEAVAADIQSCGHPLVLAELSALMEEMKKLTPADAQLSGRRVVERLGVLLQATALFHSKGDNEVYEAFVQSRIGDAHCRRGVQFGTLDPKWVSEAIVKRNTPKLEGPGAPAA